MLWATVPNLSSKVRHKDRCRTELSTTKPGCTHPLICETQCEGQFKSLCTTYVQQYTQV